MTRGFLEPAVQTTVEVSSSFNKQSGRTSNMAQHIGVPAAKSEDLHTILKTHRVENQSVGQSSL